MNTANSEPIDTFMMHSPNPSAQQISSEDREPDGVALQRNTRENYQESLPNLSKPVAKIDDVPEEEFKLSPRPHIEHSTPQVRVEPLMREAAEQAVPGSMPLGPSRLNEEEKERAARSMITLQNFGIRQNNSSSKLMQRRKRPMNLKLSVSCKCPRLSFAELQRFTPEPYPKNDNHFRIVSRDKQSKRQHQAVLFRGGDVAADTGGESSPMRLLQALPV